MKHTIRTLFATSAVSVALFAAQSRQSSAQDTLPLVPRPPGTIAQSQTAYLSGEAMNSRWRVVTSRVQLDRSPSGVQWYLSLYQQGPSAFRRVYQSPGPRDAYAIVPRIEKPPGSPRYFPMETLHVSGVGELMAPEVQQLVVGVHTTGADCGQATISVLGYDTAIRRVRPLVQVTNPCDLFATVRNGTVELRGPYYARNAPLYNPTKNNASATLRFMHGRWVEQPNYFTLVVHPRPAGRTRGGPS